MTTNPNDPRYTNKNFVLVLACPKFEQVQGKIGIVDMRDTSIISFDDGWMYSRIAICAILTSESFATAMWKAYQLDQCNFVYSYRNIILGYCEQT